MVSEPSSIIVTEIISEVLRFWRSAILPKIQPPMGRMKKPTPKMPADLSNYAVWSSPGKNEALKNSAVNA